MNRITTNILILLAAIFLSVALLYATKNPDLFSASILSLQDAETIKAKSRDVWYKNEGNVLDTFISQDLKNISSITFSVIYDYENIDLDLSQLDSQTKYEILSNDEWWIVIKFTSFSWIDYDYNQSLFELPFNGDDHTVLISEWKVNLLNWDNKYLAIWSLNSDNIQYHKAFN